MKYSNVLVALAVFLLLPISIAFGQQAQKATYTSIEQALSTGFMLQGSDGPESVNWIEGGDKFSYIQTTQNRTKEIRSYDPASGEDVLIFDGKGVIFPDTQKPFSYRSFQWSKDAKFILFQCNFRPVWRNSGTSDYYMYEVASKKLQLVAKDARTAELSPDGTKAAFERGGNLFLYELSSGSEAQLTESARDNFYNGRFGWVYEEEFGLAQAWEWSPDSRYIAFWQTDETQVPIFQMTDYSGKQAEYDKIPYPKVGDTNPTVKIGVIDVQEISKKWMDVEVGDGYIPRIYWTATAGQLAIVHLNRKQNHLSLFFHDVATGNGKKIMEEKSEQWIDVFDFFAGIMHLFFFPDNKEEFFWISDRNGWSHIYHYDYEGNLIGQVTSGEWEVTYVHAVDAQKKVIYYTSTEESPLERHLYSIRFDGKKKEKLTQVEGTHKVDFSPNAAFYIDRFSNTTTPTQVELWSTKGKLLKKLEANEQVSDFFKENTFSPRELMSFTTEDGQELDIYVVKPPNFDPNKAYPMLLNIYGGPGAQSVYNDFGVNGWEQYLAQQGYVVASVNNRGSGGYGSKFEKVVYEQLGKWESNDFVETAKFLSSKPWVDATRMGIRGHSYGGFMTSYTMLTHPGVFQAGLVGAPVTDWKLYDSIYAERYMGLLPENAEKYKNSAATSYAGQLEGHLFIAHSAMDENVHMQNTMQLVQALIDNGKDHDLRIYPPGNHGVAYNAPSYFLLYRQYTDYLEKHLKGNTVNRSR